MTLMVGPSKWLQILRSESSVDGALASSGTALLATAQRQANQLRSSHQQFPPIPQTPDAFVETGTNARPTFFGCDPLQDPPEYPLVIYLPNSPPITGADPVTKYVPSPLLF